ncbi:hypothetical protein Q9966_014910, partial [Columba livia]
MDRAVRERLRAARCRRDVQALEDAYELIKSATRESVLDPSDNFSTDLYVLCAEQAFEEGFEKFVLCFMKAIDFAAQDQRYYFLIYNASVLYWQLVRPYLQPGFRYCLIPSLSQIVNALNRTEEQDSEWRAELMVNLLECFLDASKLKEAREFSSTAAIFIKENVPDKYPQLFSLMVYHKLMDISQLEKEIQNSIHLAVVYKMQMLKLQWDTGEFPSDAAADLNAVYVLLKQYDAPPAAVLSVKIPLILELARFSLKVSCIELARDCVLDLKRAGITEQGKLIEIECLECEYEAKKIGTKIMTYTKGVVEAAENKHQGFYGRAGYRAGYIMCRLSGRLGGFWWKCYGGSLLVLLRCQVHMEIARIEEDGDRIEAAMEHLQKALSLNNGGQYEEYLRLSLKRLQLYTMLYKSPERLEDRAALLIEQAKRGKQEDDVRKKRALLINAGLALAPDSFKVVLDSENEAKVVAQKKKAGATLEDEEGDSSPRQPLLPDKSFSFERDLLRILAEIRFINGEATVQLLRLRGAELNGRAAPPEGGRRDPHPPESDPEWKTYSLWIDHLSRYAMENFQRAAEIGEELKEAWIVHNAAVYVLNYNRHLISAGRQRDIIADLQALLGAVRSVGQDGSTVVLLMLCNAVARGLILRWIPRPEPAEEKEEAADRSRKASEKNHERADIIQSFSVDPRGLPDIKAALENNDEAQDATARLLVGLEMYSCNGLGLMDFTVPSLSQLVKLALECSWSDSLVELQTLTRLVYFGYVSRDHETVMTCSRRMLQSDECFRNRDAEKHEMPGHRARQEMLSAAACIQGKSIMRNWRGRKRLRVAAARAFVQSARHAGEAGNYSLAMFAARHFWNTCVPLLGSARDRGQLEEPTDTILKNIIKAQSKNEQVRMSN